MTGFDIRDRRNDIGLSQSKLADLTGIEQARISAYELGKLNLSITEVKKIVNHLETIDETDVKKNKKQTISKQSTFRINNRPKTPQKF